MTLTKHLYLQDMCVQKKRKVKISGRSKRSSNTNTSQAVSSSRCELAEQIRVAQAELEEAEAQLKGLQEQTDDTADTHECGMVPHEDFPEVKLKDQQHTDCIADNQHTESLVIVDPAPPEKMVLYQEDGFELISTGHDRVDEVINLVSSDDDGSSVAINL